MPYWSIHGKLHLFFIKRGIKIDQFPHFFHITYQISQNLEKCMMTAKDLYTLSLPGNSLAVFLK